MAEAGENVAADTTRTTAAQQRATGENVAADTTSTTAAQQRGTGAGATPEPAEADESLAAGTSSTSPTEQTHPLPLPPLPDFVEWRFGDGGNAINRLQLVGFNFYRALCRLSTRGARGVLGDARLRVGGASDFNALGPLWVVAAHGEEVIGPSAPGGEWKLLGRFREAPMEACFAPPPPCVREMTFVWSVFTRANAKARRGTWDERALVVYAQCYLDVATRTMVAMVDAAGAPTEGLATLAPEPVCCVFNMAGGGAFLRGLGGPLEETIGQLIPCLLAAAFVRAGRLRPTRVTRLVLCGVEAQPGEGAWEVLPTPLGTEALLQGATGGEERGVKPCLLFRSTEALLQSATRGQEPCLLFGSGGEARLPPGATAVRADMLAAARAVLQTSPGTQVALCMAGDERRLGNAFLGLSQHQGRSVRVADPYIGARRASDENNTRRSSMMEVALAFAVLGGGGGGGGPPARRLAAAAAAAAEAFRSAYLQLEEQHGMRDRSAIVAAHEEESAAGRGRNRLDGCLRDMRAVQEAQKGARNVRETILDLQAGGEVLTFGDLPCPLGPAAQKQRAHRGASSGVKNKRQRGSW